VKKQRLMKLTRQEIAASPQGGWIDERVPVEDVRQLLTREPRVTFDTQSLLVDLGRIAGHARLMRDVVRLERDQKAAQARETVAVIDELVQRLLHMDPHVEALATDLLYNAEKVSVLWVRQRIAPDLYLLRAALAGAATTIENKPSRTGPRPTWWTRARDDLTQALLDRATPRLAKKAAKALAVEILALCELRSPRKDRNSPRKSS
jgi:hypothetical protein